MYSYKIQHTLITVPFHESKDTLKWSKYLPGDASLSIVLELLTYFEMGWKIHKLLLRPYCNVSISPDRRKTFRDAPYFCLSLATSIFLPKIFSFLCLLIVHFPNIIWNEDPGSNLGSNQKRKLYCHLISDPQSTHICDCPLVLKLLCKLLNYLIFLSYCYGTQHKSYLL